MGLALEKDAEECYSVDMEYIRCLIINLRCNGLTFILTPPLFHQNISDLKEYLLLQYQLFLKALQVC